MSNGDNFPEAPASITYSVITPTGFPALLTLRDEEYKDLVIKMEFIEDYFKKHGYLPQAPRSFGKKPIEYVKDATGADMLCPTCKKGHVKIIHSSKGTFYGCDTSKFNKEIGKYEGCTYFTSQDPSKTRREELDDEEFERGKHLEETIHG